MAKIIVDGVLSTRHPLYPAWASMIARCEQPACRSFRLYGGRGISVCERWRHSFPTFVADMGPKPTPQHSLDRINSDEDYSPENCRWSDAQVQSENRRGVKPVIVSGVSYPSQAAAARAHGVHPSDLCIRLKAGMPLEEALKHTRTVVVGDQSYRSLKAAAEAHGMPYKTVHMRVTKGWPIEEAVTAPVWKYRYAPKG